MIYVRARTRYKPRGGRFQVEIQQSAKSITSLIADVIFVSAVDMVMGVRVFICSRAAEPSTAYKSISARSHKSLWRAAYAHTYPTCVSACLMICDRIFQIFPPSGRERGGDRERVLDAPDILNVKSYPR